MRRGAFKDLSGESALFCVDPPWAELPVKGSFAAGRVAREYHSFIAGASQLIAHQHVNTQLRVNGVDE